MMSSLSVALCTALGAATLLLSGCDRAGHAPAPATAAPPPTEVTVLTVHARELNQGFEYVGQAVGSRETEVRARVNGIVATRLYEEGTRVKAGTPLFQIEEGNYRNQLAAAEANFALNNAKAAQAQRELNRLTPLVAEKAISQKEYDDAKSALQVSQAQLQQTHAQLDEARLNLSWTRVTAPIDGVTGLALKANGSLVSGNDNLLTTLVQTDPLFVGFSMPELDYLKLMGDVASGKVKLPGQRAANGSLGFDVKLRLADGSIYPHSGKLNFASEKINPANGSIEARASIPNPQGLLRSGQFVRVLLGGAILNRALAVPQRAVIDGQSGKIVMVLSPQNTTMPRPVELGGWSNGDWIVTKGLQEGDRVLVDGVKARKPGTPVKPVELSAQTSAQTSAQSSAQSSAQLPAQSSAQSSAASAK
jgi:membrane fusion protein (multidrug efflux system)